MPPRALFNPISLRERILVTGCFIAGLAHVWAYRAYQPDDAFIFLVYAKNLLDGHGLTFNGLRVEGFSSPLWTWLVAFGGLTRVDLLAVAKVLGWSLSFAIALAMIAIAQWIDERSSAFTRFMLIAMWFALPPAALWASGAMETLLHTLMLLVACALYFRASVLVRAPRASVAAGAALGLLAWSRPEGFAFLGVVPAFECLRAFAGVRGRGRNALLTLLAGACVVAALLAWRYAMYGNLLPITVAAKTGDLAAQWHAGSAHLIDFLLHYGWLAFAWALATVALIRRGGTVGWWAALVCMLVAGETLFSVVVGGDWMPGYRFLVPVLPLAITVIAFALHARTAVAWTALAAMLALEIHSSFPLHRMAVEQALAADGDARMGKYLAGLHLPPGQSIAVVDAGALPYYSGLRTIDMVGLNDEHIARLPGPFMRKWDNAYVLAQKPDWIQLHTYLHDGAAYPLDDFMGGIQLFYSDEFQRWYDWDAQSPVAHLFRRRAQPREGSFMDSFMRAQIDGTFDVQSHVLSVRVRKTGGGVWPAPRDTDFVHNAAVYVRVRSTNAQGSVTREELQPVPRFMQTGDEAQWQFAWNSPGANSMQLCLVLTGVGDFPGCRTLPLS